MKRHLIVVAALLLGFTFGWLSARSFWNCIPGPISVQIVVDSAGRPLGTAHPAPERGT